MVSRTSVYSTLRTIIIASSASLTTANVLSAFPDLIDNSSANPGIPFVVLNPVEVGVKKMSMSNAYNFGKLTVSINVYAASNSNIDTLVEDIEQAFDSTTNMSTLKTAGLLLSDINGGNIGATWMRQKAAKPARIQEYDIQLVFEGELE